MKQLIALLTLSLTLLCSVPAVAQTSKSGKNAAKPRTERNSQPANALRRPSFQQFVQDKTSFILREMKLSAQDSARFAPVYMQLQLEKAALMRTIMESTGEARRTYRGVPPEQWPDSVKLAMVRAEYRLGVEDATLELHYLGRFEQILTPTQLMDYSRAEKRFKQTFMSGPDRRPRNSKQPEPPAQQP